MVRVKERYLLVDILYPELSTENLQLPGFASQNQPSTDSLTAGGIVRSIKSEIQGLFGDYGAGAVERSLSVKYLSTATSTLIIRVNREHFRLVWAVLTLMDHVPVKNGKPCVFRVVRVSGTIRKIEDVVIRRAKALILAAKEEMAGRSSATLDGLFQDEAITNVTADDDEGNAPSEDDAG